MTPTPTKHCSGCGQSMPLSAFGPNAARPPLFLQSRCRTCRNAAKTQGDQMKRDQKQAAKVAADLAAIADEVAALAVAEVRMVPLVAAHGFALVPLKVLAVRRTRGRWPAKVGTTEGAALENWGALLSDAAAAQYGKAQAVHFD